MSKSYLKYPSLKYPRFFDDTARMKRELSVPLKPYEYWYYLHSLKESGFTPPRGFKFRSKIKNIRNNYFEVKASKPYCYRTKSLSNSLSDFIFIDEFRGDDQNLSLAMKRAMDRVKNGGAKRPIFIS